MSPHSPYLSSDYMVTPLFDGFWVYSLKVCIRVFWKKYKVALDIMNELSGSS